MRSIARLAVLLLLPFLCAACSTMGLGRADTRGAAPPDLKGTWNYETVGVKVLNDAKAPQVADHRGPGFKKMTWALVIDKQEGPCFSGYVKSDKVTERIAGVIGFDNQAVYWADADGVNLAELVSPDRMERVYVEATRASSVAGRAVLIREKP